MAGKETRHGRTESAAATLHRFARSREKHMPPPWTHTACSPHESPPPSRKGRRTVFSGRVHLGPEQRKKTWLFDTAYIRTRTGLLTLGAASSNRSSIGMAGSAGGWARCSGRLALRYVCDMYVRTEIQVFFLCDLHLHINIRTHMLRSLVLIFDVAGGVRAQVLRPAVNSTQKTRAWNATAV